MASHGSVAIITGAAQGIGYAISDALLLEGYKVCLCDVNSDKGNESRAELQKKYAADRVIFVPCDVTSKPNFEEVFTTTQKEFGRIDVVVNNAGVVDEHNRSLMTAINFMGTVYGCELALKYMGTKDGGQGGAVVNMASLAGIVAWSTAPVYSATKHAVVGLTRAYGDKTHFDENGVIFMAMCPSYVLTSMIAPLGKDAQSVALKPEKIAEGVVILLKDRHNGSTLMALPEGLLYAKLDEKLSEIKEKFESMKKET